MTLTVQFITMAAMIVSGLYLGMSLDTFRRFSPYFKNNVFLTYSLEISFWLMQAFILFFYFVSNEWRGIAGLYRFSRPAWLCNVSSNV